ncbi:MAG: GNAT family N-acetyltransferase [Pseudobdellovibrionaceae bacterium]
MEKYQLTRVIFDEDLIRVYPIMRELRTKLSVDDFLSLYHHANATCGYEIIALEENQTILALIGYRTMYDFVHGKHLYIDDLVTTQAQRSKGLGAKLLAYAEKVAIEFGCSGLRLCTGVNNELGKKFYEREKWEMRAVVYKKRLGSDF